jgi:hypothetical protein
MAMVTLVIQRKAAGYSGAGRRRQSASPPRRSVYAFFAQPAAVCCQ